MSDLISVIVPIYNIEKYIDRCVESVVNQTYKNLEIILVDDGSTDNSSSVCDDWAKRDSRIKVIHKKNGGLSDARNFGLDNAKGDYIAFVDGDDFIDINMYDSMLNYLKKYNCDICICGINKIENGREFITRPYMYSNNEFTILNNENALVELLNDRLDVSSCNKLYKKEIINDLRFPYGITNEDFALMYKFFYRSNQIIIINENYYKYIQRQGSITTTKFNERQFDKYYNCIQMMDFIEENIPNLINEAKYYLWYHTFCLLKQLYLENLIISYSKYAKELKTTLKKDSFIIMKSKKLSYKEKIIYLVISFFPRIYVLIHKI